MTFASTCVQPAGTVSLLVPIALCCSMAQQQKEDATSPLGKMFNILYKLSSLLPCFPIKSWSEFWAVCFAPFKFLSQNFMLKKRTHNNDFADSLLLNLRLKSSMCVLLCVGGQSTNDKKSSMLCYLYYYCIRRTKLHGCIM